MVCRLHNFSQKRGTAVENSWCYSKFDTFQKHKHQWEQQLAIGNTLKPISSSHIEKRNQWIKLGSYFSFGYLLPSELAAEQLHEALLNAHSSKIHSICIRSTQLWVLAASLNWAPACGKQMYATNKIVACAQYCFYLIDVVFVPFCCCFCRIHLFIARKLRILKICSLRDFCVYRMI